MNTDDTRIDRLVDDELSEEERRQLLGQLDDEPGGWRRCALAFLEAQCWRKVFGETPSVRDALSAALQSGGKKAGETPALRGETATHLLETPRRSVWLGRMKVLSAMAASFLLALWAGNLAHRAWVGRMPGPAGMSSMGDVAQMNKGFSPVIAVNDPERSVGSLPAQSGNNSMPWHLVTVSATSDGQHSRPAIQVPAVERNNIDEQWLRSVPPAIPDNVLQALARTGHQIEQQREFVPVPLKDGRQLVVPVDRVNVRYIGNGPY
jgi:hypothetical protein